jgi:hypothetical protein
MESLSESESIYWFPAGCSFDHLHGKTVQFEIGGAEIWVSGMGFFRVREHESGEQCVEITTTVEQFPGTRATHVFRLLHAHVARIRPHPDPKFADYQIVEPQ